MSKTRKKCLGSDSAKIVIDQAKREVPNFIEHDEKFEQKNSYSRVLFKYTVCFCLAVAKLSLSFKTEDPTTANVVVSCSSSNV